MGKAGDQRPALLSVAEAEGVTSGEEEDRDVSAVGGSSGAIATDYLDRRQHPVHGAPVANTEPPASGKTGSGVVATDAATGAGSGGVSSEQEAGEQAANSRSLVSKKTGEQPANVVNFPAPNKQGRSLVSGKLRSKRNKDLASMLTSEQEAGEQAADWLKSVLPTADNGWWEVRPEGKGFTVKFRWRGVDGKQQTQTFPRVSSEQYRTLKEMSNAECRDIISERIAGHLEDCSLDGAKAGKARLAATRLRIELEDYRTLGWAN